MKKILVKILFVSIGLILGIFWLITTGSYFLLFFALFFGFLLGYLFGSFADQSIEFKNLDTNTSHRTKKR